jgi:hypothetical protein
VTDRSVRQRVAIGCNALIGYWELVCHVTS